LTLNDFCELVLPNDKNTLRQTTLQRKQVECT